MATADGKKEEKAADHPNVLKSAALVPHYCHPFSASHMKALHVQL
jgi:hypothetical protein